MEEIEQEQQLKDELDTQREPETTAPEPESPKKIGVMFFFILLILCVMADFIDLLTLGTVGWLFGLFVDAVLLVSVGLSKAGRRQFKRTLVGVIGDTIPFLNIMPLRSLFFIWSFIKSREEPPIHEE